MPDIDDPNRQTQSQFGKGRRNFLIQLTSASIGLTLAPLLPLAESEILNQQTTKVSTLVNTVDIILHVNGKEYPLTIDPRVTLLDALREKLKMFGTKKGCDHGQCGACTVLVNDRRINSCLHLAAMCSADAITTIEGLANGNSLHPVQAAFIKHDAFQCGYCTPGQICSAVGLINERKAKTSADIKELMSGNICRCAAYPNILSAVSKVYNKA